MSIYKKWDGSIKIRNIMITIAIVVIAVVLISVYNSISKGEKITDIVKNSIDRQNIDNFLQKLGKVTKGLLISLLVILPLFIYGWFEVIEKESAFVWGIFIGILLFLFGVSNVPIRTAITVAWIINIIILYFAIKSELDKKQYGMKAWFIFATISTFSAPWYSLVNGNADESWFVIALLGIVISFFLRDVKFEKIHVKMRKKFKTMIGKTIEIFKEIDKKCALFAIQTQAANESIIKLEKELNELRTAINSRNPEEIRRIASNVDQTSQPLGALPELEVTASAGISSMLEENMQEQTRKAISLKESLIDDDKFKSTELGKVQAELRTIATRTLEELKSKNSGWEEFLKMKENGFKGIVDRLKATKIGKLERYAKFLESHAQKMWIKTFIGLMLKWAREIETERKKAIANIERAEKELREKTSETKLGTGYEIDENIRQTAEDFELLKKYDLQLKEQHVKMIKLIKGIDAVGVEEAASKIEEMKGIVGWIGKYMGDRERALKKIRERMINAQRYTENEFDEIEKGVLPSAEIEFDVSELIGSEAVA